MPSQDLKDAECPIAWNLATIRETWSLLILRSLAQGFCCYHQLRNHLGISPSMLSKRLGELADVCLVKKELYQENPPRYAYSLTERGEDFLPVIAALVAYGSRQSDVDGVEPHLMDRETRRKIDPIVVDAQTREPLDFKRVTFGFGTLAAKPGTSN